MHTSATPDIIKELYRIDMTAEWPKNTNTEVALARQTIGAQDDDFQVHQSQNIQQFKSQVKRAAEGMEE
jgi:hypothetical protein